MFEGNLLNGTEEQRTWWVPVSYTDKTEQDFENTTPKVWLSPANLTLDVPNILSNPEDWIILNTQKTAFYRINYDVPMWNKIRSQLDSNSSVIHHLNRAQIIDDIFSLGRAGKSLV